MVGLFPDRLCIVKYIGIYVHMHSSVHIRLFECLKVLNSYQHLGPGEKVCTKGHPFWLSLSRHFSKQWCQEIEHREQESFWIEKTEIRVWATRADWGRLLERRDL